MKTRLFLLASLLATPLLALTAELTITNELLTARWTDDPPRLSLRANASGREFLRDATLSASGGVARITTASGKTFGAGQAIEISYPNGGRDVVMLFPKLPFETFAAAARAGNPQNVAAFNAGVIPRLISVTPHEDYTAGEINDPATVQIRRSVNGKLDGKQIQVLSYLGRTWGRGEPRFTNELAIQHSQTVRKTGGAITWDVPVQLDGRIPESFVVQLRAIGNVLNSTKAEGSR